MSALQPGTTLQSGKYKIIKVLGQGGFGITYLAENTMLDGKMAIKEFFFKEYCDREEATSHVTIPTSGNREIVERFRQKFIKEARTIFRLKHPNIVGLYDIFEENGTAYYVMDYIDGESLGDMVKRRGSVPEAEAVGYIKEAGKALFYIHSKMMTHLDIKPGNIMKRREDGKIIVIDFGVAKQYDVVTERGTTTTPVGISAGYSPSEQYKKNGVGDFSPQSDVYALAATLYKLLTGKTPPEAMEVIDEGLPVGELQAKGVSLSVINAISAAMQTRNKRTQSVDAFIAELDGKHYSSEETVFIDTGEEVTRLTPENQRIEERKRKEAEAKAEARAKAEAERKAKEEAERKARETEEQHKREKAAANKQKFYILVGIMVAVAVFFGIMAYSAYGDSVNEGSSVEASYSDSVEASYSDGEINVNGVLYKMVSVQGGTFTIGATSEMKEPYDNEKPAHQVTLSDFSIGQTEVTQALWKAVMGNNPSYFKGDNLPVECVSWDDCQTFISKLNSLTGRKFRLPTEAEWEFAARGGNNSNHTQYSGSSNIADVAWYGGNSGGKTHPVAQKQSNELGLYDMSGNVWEWCSDWYGNYDSNVQTNPTGASSGSCRVRRGGSWDDDAWLCRSSYRGSFDPGYSDDDLGFRLVLSE